MWLASGGQLEAEGCWIGAKLGSGSDPPEGSAEYAASDYDRLVQQPQGRATGVRDRKSIWSRPIIDGRCHQRAQAQVATAWAGEGFKVEVDGEEIGDLPKPGSYVELKREWKTGDTIALKLPKTLKLEPLADNPGRVAILWGPLVLAGDLGPERQFEGRRGRRGESPVDEQVPVFVAADKPVAEWLKPVGDTPGHFATRRRRSRP